MKELRKRNHYVSRSYLRAWSNDGKNVYIYHTLVPSEKVQQWVKKSIKSIACQKHFYTNTVAGNESDEIEKWMANEIESPAHTVLNKLRKECSITEAEWPVILRYIALHDVRTPFRFIQSLGRMKHETPVLLEKTLKNAISLSKLKTFSACRVKKKDIPSKDTLPIKLTTVVDPVTNIHYWKIKTVVGRGLWLTSIRHVLNSTYSILAQHKWIIIEAPEGYEWFTSDNPVIKLNYYGGCKYDLMGGWNNPGTEIMFPLSPHFLLYTKVGEAVSINQCTVDLAKKLLFFIAKNSYRQIYASKPLDIVVTLRTREVDLAKYNAEKEAWENLHKDQKAAETNLFEGD